MPHFNIETLNKVFDYQIKLCLDKLPDTKKYMLFYMVHHTEQPYIKNLCIERNSESKLAFEVVPDELKDMVFDDMVSKNRLPRFKQKYD